MSNIINLTTHGQQKEAPRQKKRKEDEDNCNSHTSSFWDCFSKMIGSTSISHITKETNIDSISNIALIPNKILTYLATHFQEQNSSPHTQWKQNKIKYPILFKMEKVYLCTPAGSVYTEKFFFLKLAMYLKTNHLIGVKY